jgi:uncharacterized protein YndB with AHSA1/START domain
MADFRTSIRIDAPPEIVFAYLTDAGRMLTWMGEWADLDPVPGGNFGVNVNTASFRGRYLEVEPPRRVVVSWGLEGSDDLPPGSSRVEFILTPTVSGTELSLRHSGLPETRARTHSSGWSHHLGQLQLAVTGRLTVNRPFSTTNVNQEVPR